MNEKKINRTLQKIADREGVSVNKIRQEIELAIIAAQENPDPQMQMFWKSIPHKEDKPTPEEVIAYIIGLIGDKKENIEFYLK